MAEIWKCATRGHLCSRLQTSGTWADCGRRPRSRRVACAGGSSSPPRHRFAAGSAEPHMQDKPTVCQYCSHPSSAGRGNGHLSDTIAGEFTPGVSKCSRTGLPALASGVGGPPEIAPGTRMAVRPQAPIVSPATVTDPALASGAREVGIAPRFHPPTVAPGRGGCSRDRSAMHFRTGPPGQGAGTSGTPSAHAAGERVCARNDRYCVPGLDSATLPAGASMFRLFRPGRGYYNEVRIMKEPRSAERFLAADRHRRLGPETATRYEHEMAHLAAEV